MEPRINSRASRPKRAEVVDRENTPAVQARITQLKDLPDDDFIRAVRDFLRRPDDDEAAALRSDAIVQRTHWAILYLRDNVRTSLEHEAEGSDRKRGMELLRNAIRREERLTLLRVNGLRAKTGQMPMAPNPRGRAMRRLAAEYPVEFLKLLREEQALDDLRKKLQRHRSKALRSSWDRGTVAAVIEDMESRRVNPPTWSQFERALKDMKRSGRSS
ncbi:hypothetical protein ABN028_19960 [Actinopolymorpha sp. B17G11]|uniref:hypothetical protein n=1 Tax=Actinopolymorpha sp. B17G11 TaxID=3160861 RepID=UPI0032E43C6A